MNHRLLLLLLLLFSAHPGARAAASAPDIGFNYQGSLTQGGAPASGNFDFAVDVYDDLIGGNLQHSQTHNAVGVSGGIFSLDLTMPPALLGIDIYLEIGVRPAGSGAFTPLNPRQAVKAAPFAHRAFSVDLNSIHSFHIINGSIDGVDIGGSEINGGHIVNGSVAGVDIAAEAIDGSHIADGGIGGVDIGADAIDGSHIADGSIGAADVDPNAVQWRVDNGCPGGSAIRVIGNGGEVTCEPVVTGGGWSLTGNAGTTPGTHFLGTTDNVPLQIHVNDQRIWRAEWLPGSGGPNGPAITAGHPNNSIVANSVGSVISGGGVMAAPNQILSGATNAIGGGLGNSISAGSATIAGGSANSITGDGGSIGGGGSNTVGGDHATVPGGQSNAANGRRSFAAGHQAQALHDNSFVFNDGGGVFASTDVGQFLIDVSTGVGIGTDNPSDLLHVSAPAGRDALRVQIDGTTRLRVHDNGGVSVGLNTTPPPEGLVVKGDIKLANAVTRWKTFAAAEFVPTESTSEYRSDGGYLAITDVPGSNNEEFAVGLHLPHGATVTQLRAVVLDDDGFQDIKVRIRRREIAGALDEVVMAEISTSTTNASIQALTDSTIVSATIDNQNYSYVVDVDSGGAAGGDIRLYNARVSYTLTTVLP